MPGVEVLANAIDTILRSRFYAETGDGASFLWAALTAIFCTLLLLERSQGKWEAIRQSAGLILLTEAVVVS